MAFAKQPAKTRSFARNEIEPDLGKRIPTQQADFGTDDQPNPQVYFANFLIETISITGAVAGQVWGLSTIGQLAKVASTNPKLFQKLDDPKVVAQHRELLSESLLGEQASVTVSSVSEADQPNRTIHLARLRLENEPVGVVELILPTAMDDGAKLQFQTLLRNAEAYLVRQAKRPQSGHEKNHWQGTKGDESNRNSVSNLDASDSAGSTPQEESKDRSLNLSPGVSFEAIEEFIFLLNNQTEIRYVSATAVNELCRIVGCDRASIAALRNGQSKVLSISGVDKLEKNTDTAQAIKELAGLTIERGQEIGCDNLQPNALVADDNVPKYLDASGAYWFRAFPLFEPEHIDFDSSIHVSDPKPFAALVLENFSSKPHPESQIVQRLGVHLSQALFHALAAEDVFLLPTRRKLGRWSRLAKLTPAKITACVAAFILFALSMVFIDIPYRIEASGRLMPVQQFRGFAPFDGKVQRIDVSSQQTVRAGQTLVRITSETISSQALAFQNQIAEKNKLLQAYRAQLDNGPELRSSDERTMLTAKIAQFELEIDGLTEQLQLVNNLLSQSSIKSPFAGTVATFRPDDLLSGRPVTRGDLLIEVMQESGPWQLELDVQEKRISHLLTVLSSGSSPTSNDTRADVEVAFVQATAPEVSNTAVVSEIANRITRSEDGSTSIRVIAKLPSGEPTVRTIGAQVQAKIDCGRKPMGYVWFGDIVDWINRQVW